MTTVVQSSACRRHIRSGASSRSWKCVSTLPGITMLTRIPCMTHFQHHRLVQSEEPKLAGAVSGATAKRVPARQRLDVHDAPGAGRHEVGRAAFEQ